jgi:FkbM family methyltransferase
VAAVARERPTRTFAEYFWCLKNTYSFIPDACIDVGAGAGTHSIYGAFPNQFHILIEPLETLLPDLQKAASSLQHVIYNLALMDRPGHGQVKKGKNLLTSTLMHRPSPESSTEDLQDTDISTLDDLMQAHAEFQSVLLKTDCQGADLLVLQGGVETLKKCEVVIVESSFFRFWGDHQPDFYDIVHFMKQQGFVVHDLLDGLFRPSDRALGQIDVAFVKESGRFRQKRFW